MKRWETPHHGLVEVERHRTRFTVRWPLGARHHIRRSDALDLLRELGCGRHAYELLETP